MAGNLNYMNAKDVIDSNLGLLGRRLFGQGNEMGRLRESVHYGQNYHIALEGGRAVTKSSVMWDQGLEGTDSG